MFCRDPDGGRGSVAARASKHDSKHDSTPLAGIRNSEDIRNITIELPQPILPRVSTGPAGPDWVRKYVFSKSVYAVQIRNQLAFCDIILNHDCTRKHSYFHDYMKVCSLNREKMFVEW